MRLLRPPGLGQARRAGLRLGALARLGQPLRLIAGQPRDQLGVGLRRGQRRWPGRQFAARRLDELRFGLAALGQRANPGGFGAQRDPLEQHVAADHLLQALPQSAQLRLQRLQLAISLLGRLPPCFGFRLQLELAPGRDLPLQLQLVDELTLRGQLLTLYDSIAQLGDRERADQRGPQRGDQPEPQ